MPDRLSNRDVPNHQAQPQRPEAELHPVRQLRIMDSHRGHQVRIRLWKYVWKYVGA